MERFCNGEDYDSLTRTSVTTTEASAKSQEQTEYRPCSCGLRYDDTLRLMIYPHRYYLKTGETVVDLAGNPLEPMEASHQLTALDASSTLPVMTEQAFEGGRHEDPAVESAETEVVSAEGTSNTEDGLTEPAEEREERLEEENR